MNEPKFSIPVLIFSAVILLVTLFSVIDMFLSMGWV